MIVGEQYDAVTHRRTTACCAEPSAGIEDADTGIVSGQGRDGLTRISMVAFGQSAGDSTMIVGASCQAARDVMEKERCILDQHQPHIVLSGNAIQPRKACGET